MRSVRVIRVIPVEGVSRDKDAHRFLTCGLSNALSLNIKKLDMLGSRSAKALLVLKPVRGLQ